MSGDYSRESFDPRNHFSEVLQQQGRVGLDSDFNELVAIIDRRFRAETVDIIGRATVPRETPDGFRIAISGTGDSKVLTIGPGRIYVDGLLAENHGNTAGILDLNLPRPDGSGPAGVLGEPLSLEPVSYVNQPHYPDPPALPEDDGEHLIYLDVFKREVTAVQDEDLLEKALGGVDTTTRVQTVWQVKVLPDVEAITCSTPAEDIPGWLNENAPSAGILTTGPVTVEDPDDPCLLPPSSGYSGLENQLYRVEIHDAGPPGTATFKWSRENASVVCSVETFGSPSILRLNRIGRDDFLRLNVEDWVEVTDDIRELSGRPGEMRRVVGITEELNEIELSSALPAMLVPTGVADDTPQARHSRVRRWDQSAEVRDINSTVLVNLDDQNSGGVIPIPTAGTSLVLERGVQVTFGINPAGGAFRAMDYWVFAARSIDRSVEVLTEAPPQGIHHHYCKLAVVSFPDSAVDCRNYWPPDWGHEGCDCTVCVTPESHESGVLTVQDGIDQVRPVGGKVCLAPGVYRLRAPLLMQGANSVKLQGKGWKSILMHLGVGPAVFVEGSAGVTIDELSIVRGTQPQEPPTIGPPTQIAAGIVLRNSLGVTVQNVVVVLVAGLGATPAPGLTAPAAAGPAGSAIVLTGFLGEIRIRDNLLVGGIGVGALTGPVTEPGPGATVITTTQYLATADLFVQDNLILARDRGVSLEGITWHLAEMRIAGNRILGSQTAGVVARGGVWPGEVPSRVHVCANLVQARGDAIVVGSDNALVESNEVGGDGTRGSGILVTGGFTPGPVNRLKVISNRIKGVRGAGISIRHAVETGMVKLNVIEEAGGGIVMDPGGSGVDLIVDNNQIRNLTPGAETQAPLLGISMNLVHRLRVAGNLIDGVGVDAPSSTRRSGIWVTGAASATIDGNEIGNVGPPGQFLNSGAGIEVDLQLGRLDITNNAVRRRFGVPVLTDNSTWWAINLARTWQNGGGVSTNGITIATLGELHLGFTGTKVFKLPRGRASLGVRGNVAEAYGRVPPIQLSTDGACVLTENRCFHGAEQTPASVSVWAGAIVASNNYVEGPPERVSMILNSGSGPFTVLGNIVSGPILVTQPGGGLGPLMPPWVAFNIVAT